MERVNWCSVEIEYMDHIKTVVDNKSLYWNVCSW